MNVYGTQPEELPEDKKSMMIMYNIGKNMAWMINCIKLGIQNGLEYPVNEKLLTNFTW